MNFKWNWTARIWRVILASMSCTLRSDKNPLCSRNESRPEYIRHNHISTRQCQCNAVDGDVQSQGQRPWGQKSQWSQVGIYRSGNRALGWCKSRVGHKAPPAHTVITWRNTWVYWVSSRRTGLKLTHFIYVLAKPSISGESKGTRVAGEEVWALIRFSALDT
jgi:hypothetical protein